MTLKELPFKIDVTRADICLDDPDMSRSYIYTAIDESGLILATKIYNAQTPHNRIDFIDHILKEKQTDD